MTDPYEEVRRRLKERGYLDGRVERFVLSGPASRGRVGSLAATSGRAALVGGPILGVLLTAAVVAANRPILAAADGPVLWAYFSVLAGAGLFVLAVATGGATAALARRRGARPGDSHRASILVGLLALAYVALLAWTQPAVSASWEEALVLAAGLGATLVAAWLGGLVSLAGIIGRTGQVPDRARRPLVKLALVLVPVAAAAMLLRVAGGARPGHGEIAPPDFERFPSGAPVVLVGVDGLDAGLVEGLEAKGAVRTLLSRFAEGAVFPLRRAASREPAEVWTTFVTGMGVELHGVGGAGAERLPGVATPLRRDAGPLPLRALIRYALPTRTVPTTGAFRSVRSIWEIAALKEGVAAVGWWASWPAPQSETQPHREYVVTDRVLPKLLAGANGDRDTAPESLFTRLRTQFDADRESLRAEFDLRFRTLESPELARIAWESFLIDGWNARAMSLLSRDDGVQAAFVYLPGLDILRARLRRPEGRNRLAAERGEAVAAYVAWLDGLIDRLAGRDPGSRVVLIGDPGRSASAGSEGFVHVRGDGVRPGCVGAALTDLDIAPLSLLVLGFPPSREMKGSAPPDCLDLPRAPSVATYGLRSVPRTPPPGADDPEILERLRSLGYVQ